VFWQGCELQREVELSSWHLLATCHANRHTNGPGQDLYKTGQNLHHVQAWAASFWEAGLAQA
jgi:hypothetical protein